MFSIEILIASILVLLITLLLWKFYRYPSNLPPGPTGLALLDYVPFRQAKPHVKLLEAKEQYGDIFSLKLGAVNLIFLASYDAIKTALINQASVFNRRPEYLDMLTDIKAPGMIFSNGEVWTELRRLTLSKFRDLGLGKSSYEPKVQDELHYLLQELEKQYTHPTNIGQILRLSVTNSFVQLLYGHRFTYNDENLKSLFKTIISITSIASIKNVAVVMPQLLVKLLRLDNPRDHVLKLYNIMEKMIHDVKIGKTDNNQNSFVEMWFQEMEKVKGKSTNINEKTLARILCDFFIAGSDTTSLTLTWAVLYLIKYPEVQQKVQKEIDLAIGRERIPTMSDMKNMPYTEATLIEINRIITIAPFGAPHSVSQDTTLNNYLIPKSAIVIAYMHAAHHDPKIFPQPNEFKPERFLTEENHINRREEVIPFSIGKRQCIGEGFARMILFLYFTTLFQHFTFKTHLEKPVNLEYTFGGVLEPVDQFICAVPRSSKI